ncbi:MAG: DnaA/Hda family protein, partial [Muribaculaceae bacterium]
FYQSIDVLIMDDIQEFAGKTATQNTFYHIFNHLHQNQKQLILSSDCRPVDMDGFVPRLMSRFKWGVTAELSQPDYSLRRNVLTQKASQDGLSIPTDVLDFIADNVTDSIRELEGIVLSLMTRATFLNQEISIDSARAVISNAVKISKRQVNFEYITEVVSSYFNIDSDKIFGKSRKREISDARQVVMFLAKKFTKFSSTTIGLKLSRNHATVLHACKTIEERLSIDKTLQGDLQKIESELKK